MPNYIGACNQSSGKKTIGIPVISEQTLPAEIQKSFDETVETFKGMGFSIKTIDLPHSQYQFLPTTSLHQLKALQT